MSYLQQWKCIDSLLTVSHTWGKGGADIPVGTFLYNNNIQYSTWAFVKNIESRLALAYTRCS